MQYMKRLLLVATLCLAACGQQQQQSVASPPADHIAGPVRPPCLFPTSDELAIMAATSSVVAIGQADSGQVVYRAGISTPYTRQTFHVQSILRGAAPSKDLVIEEIGGTPFEPGVYILFLAQAGGTYSVNAGLDGAFPVRSNGVVRECPTFPATRTKQEAPGGGMALQSFTDMIRNLPIVTIPHK